MKSKRKLSPDDPEFQEIVDELMTTDFSEIVAIRKRMIMAEVEKALRPLSRMGHQVYFELRQKKH
jgi:hypothetical protein